jgi:hypothetical protein
MVFRAALIEPERVLKEDMVLAENTLVSNDDPGFAKQADTPTCHYKRSDVDIDRLSFDKPQEEISFIWANALRDFDWAITYLDPNWSNASIRIETDKGLRVAVQSLRLRRDATVKFRVR